MHRLLTGPLKVESVTVGIANLPQHLDGCRIVQLSDFHYDGLRLSPWLLRQAIAAVNRTEADLVVLTGDFITTDPQPIHDLVPHLKHLRSRAGLWAVLGNHDLYYQQSSRQVVGQALEAAGISVLWNQIAYPLGPGLALIGLADLWSKEFNPAVIMANLDPAIPRLVLAHNPDTADSLRLWRVDLQLSGHSHGGQIIIPGFKPLPAYFPLLRATLPRWLKRYLPYMKEPQTHVVQERDWFQGLHQVGNNLLYVNRGLGTYLPGRLCCPPEVTVITLTPQPEPYPSESPRPAG